MYLFTKRKKKEEERRNATASDGTSQLALIFKKNWGKEWNWGFKVIIFIERVLEKGKIYEITAGKRRHETMGQFEVSCGSIKEAKLSLPLTTKYFLKNICKIS